MDIELVKQGLGIDEGRRIRITPVSNGFNVRYLSTYVEERKLALDTVPVPRVGICAKCGRKTYVSDHHIVPRSAGGGDEEDNKLPLCWDDHRGDNGIHLGKWSILDVVEEDKLMELKIRYGVIRGEQHES